MKLPHFNALFALALLLAAPGAAQAADLRDAVLTQIGGFEDPVDATSLQGLGDEVGPTLMAIAEDRTVPRTTRARALAALGWFPTDQTRALLVAALDGTDALLARKAVVGLGRGWGAGALPELSRALGSEDAHLREAAARALGSLEAPEARAALEARLAVEETAHVRETLSAALGSQVQP